MEEKTISDSDAVVAPGEDLIASEVLHRRSDSVDTPRRRLEHDESSDSDADNEVAGMFDVTENKPWVCFVPKRVVGRPFLSNQAFLVMIAACCVHELRLLHPLHYPLSQWNNRRAQHQQLLRLSPL
jgi:hypothetical protein